MGRWAAAPVVWGGVLIPATAALLAAIGRRALLVRGAAFGQLATAVRRVAAVVMWATLGTIANQVCSISIMLMCTLHYLD